MTIAPEAPTVLYNLTVAQASAMIASKDLSVLEYNMAFIERTDELEPHIKAYAYLDREGWLAEAAACNASHLNGAVTLTPSIGRRVRTAQACANVGVDRVD